MNTVSKLGVLEVQTCLKPCKWSFPCTLCRNFMVKCSNVASLRTFTFGRGVEFHSQKSVHRTTGTVHITTESCLKKHIQAHYMFGTFLGSQLRFYRSTHWNSGVYKRTKKLYHGEPMPECLEEGNGLFDIRSHIKFDLLDDECGWNGGGDFFDSNQRDITHRDSDYIDSNLTESIHGDNYLEDVNYADGIDRESSNEESNPGDSNLAESYLVDRYQGDLGSLREMFGNEWYAEFRDMQEKLKCSDEKLEKLVVTYPRLKDVTVLHQVNDVVKILVDKGIACNMVYSKLLSSQGVLLQIKLSELTEVFQDLDFKRGQEGKRGNRKYNKYWYSALRAHLLTRLKGDGVEENMKFLARLLDVEHMLVTKLHSATLSSVINNKISTYLLKEKVDFLLYEGLSPEDIAYNIELLTMSMKFLAPEISEMKSILKEISIPTLKIKYYNSKTSRDSPQQKKMYLLLDCSSKKFSRQQKVFLGKIYQTNAINVALYLFDKGVSKSEIIDNPYVLGHKLDNVRDCFEKRLELCNAIMENNTEVRKLLDLVVYDLEYGESAV